MAPDTEALQKRIQYLRDTQKLSFRQIAETLGIPREKCSKLYCGIHHGHLTRPKLLDDYRHLIAQWYHDCATLKAVQVFDRLKQRQVAVSYPTVSLYTREFRKKKTKCYWPLEFLPGEEAQVDWFFFNHPLLGKLCGFAMVLSFSRFLFSRFFPRSSFEFFIEGHLLAFDYFKGLPRALRYDNLKSVVLKRTPLTFNPAFSDFARFYGFEIRLCNVAAGNEKGRVERVIRTMRERFCDENRHQHSLDSLNQSLALWVEEKNQTIHRSTNKTPKQLMPEENLRQLPSAPWHNRVILAPKKPSKTGLITFDTNHYSVPDYLVAEFLSIHASPTRVEIYSAKGRKVAGHPRCFGRNQTLINPAHRSINRLSSQAKEERIYNLIKNLDPAAAAFLARNEQTGDSAFCAAHYIFTALQIYGRQTVLSALREVVKANTPRVAALAALLHPVLHPEQVFPQKLELLTIDYQPRPLEEYDPGK